MSRRKRTPEERAEAKQKAEERLAAKLQRQTDSRSSWPGFDVFWERYPHTRIAHRNTERLAKYLARLEWDTERPSPQTFAAILRKLAEPGTTVDPKTGQSMLAGQWLNELRWLELEATEDGIEPGKRRHSEGPNRAFCDISSTKRDISTTIAAPTGEGKPPSEGR